MGTIAVTGSIGYSIGAAVVAVTAPALGVGIQPLSAFGSTKITVSVSVGGVPVSDFTSVAFSSVCGNSGKAVLGSTFTTAGVAEITYRDNGCATTDFITASALGVSSLPTSLVVTPPAIGSIQFVSAAPSIISLKGIGGVETAQVLFKVLDTGGNPLSGKTVNFCLSTTVGGITLTPSTAAPNLPCSFTATATSDGNGSVGTVVNAGTVSTPVRVTASTTGAAGATLTTQSSGLTITTGIPDQDSFSLSATKLNIEGRDFDGVTTVLTARLADHFNNPVPNGTLVNFTTEGGSIVGSCSTLIDSNGSSNCSSTLTSQNPRPADGRATVLAYAVGEESFIDLNGNGLADAGEITGDLPEAFRDDNEDGVFNAGIETFIDFNNNASYNAADGLYSGVLCNAASGACSTNKTIHVRRSVVIVFSGSTAVITKTAPAGTINLVGLCSGTSVQVDLRIVDAIGNAMPVGTTIVITTTDGTVGTGTFTQVNSNATPPAGANYSVSVRDDSVSTTSINPVTGATVTTCSDANLSGVLTVTVTTPGGTVTTAQFPVIN